jgi:hypothetical protein
MECEAHGYDFRGATTSRLPKFSQNDTKISPYEKKGVRLTSLRLMNLISLELGAGLRERCALQYNDKGINSNREGCSTEIKRTLHTNEAIVTAFVKARFTFNSIILLEVMINLYFLQKM